VKNKRPEKINKFLFMKEDIIAGLDIGSSETKLVVAQRNNKEEGNKIQVIGATSVPTEGISKGVIKSIDDVTSTISALLEKGERLVGVPIESVWLGINDPYVKCEKSKGVVAVGKSNGEISPEDVDRAIEAAQTLSVPINYEILHVLPVNFAVDNQKDIKDPVGMNGVRLEVEVLVIQGVSSQIKNLTKAIHRTKVEIEDLVLSPLALGEAIISGKQRELGVAVVDIGSSTTSVAVFEEEKLIHTSILPLGSEHITADMAIGLRCPINLAERIKLEYGHANPGQFSQKDSADVTDLVKEEEVNDDIGEVSRKYIAEIIEARTEEIFEKVDEELEKIERSGMLPAGVLLAGGGSKLPGVVDVAKNKLRLPVSVGEVKNMETIIDKVNDPNFLPAVGLVIWGGYGLDRKEGGIFSGSKEGVKKAGKKVKDLFSKLMP